MYKIKTTQLQNKTITKQNNNKQQQTTANKLQEKWIT